MSQGREKRPLRFMRVPHPLMSQPCVVPTSHKTDSNGYVRVTKRGAKNDRARPLHRTVYEARHGPGSIPEGWEVDHICGNRACCNPSHLRVLSRSEHKRVTSALRYADDQEAVWAHWVYYRSSAKELAEVYGFKAGTITGWIKRWEKDPAFNPSLT